MQLALILLAISMRTITQTLKFHISKKIKRSYHALRLAVNRSDKLRCLIVAELNHFRNAPSHKSLNFKSRTIMMGNKVKPP